MNENLEQINEAIKEQYESLKNHKPGTDEYSSIVDAIKILEQARNEMIKTDSELAVREDQDKLNKFDLVIKALGWVGVPVLVVSIQTAVNIMLFEFEKTDVMNHRGFNNNLLNFIKK